MRRLANYIFALLRDLMAAVRMSGDAGSFRTLASDFLMQRVMRFIVVPGQGMERSIRLRGGTVLHYRRSRADIWALHEIWVDETYRLPVSDPCRVIVDLGANIGLASVWLARRYGGERVIAVEPMPPNAALARKNLESNKIRSIVVEAAIGPCAGLASFDEGPGATNGRVIGRVVSQTAGAGTVVPMVTMDAINEQLPDGEGVDLVKIDIEGGEADLFSSNTTWLGRVRSVVAEFHHALIDYPRIGAVLRDAGFLRVGAPAALDGNSLEFFMRMPPGRPRRLAGS